MAKAYKTIPLPLSWVAHKTNRTEEVNSRDYLLDGEAPKPNTKKFLRQKMFRAGWSHESLLPKNQKLARSKVRDIGDTMRPAAVDDLDELCTELCKLGVPAKPKTTNLHTSVLWNSLSQRPWWLSTNHGPKHLVVLGHESSKLQATSAAFMEDLWSGLSDGLHNRFPPFRRLDLLTMMEPQAMNSILEASQVDLLVLSGGLLDDDATYHNYSYLRAIADHFPGFVVYESLVPEGLRVDTVANVAHRTGFQNIVGI